MCKRILDCISSKTFFEWVNKIFIGFIFSEPFPYLKTDLNQNYPQNFSDMKIWQHFCIDFHCIKQTIKQYWRHIEVVSVAAIFLLQSIEAFKNANILFVIKLGWQNMVGNLHKLIIFKLNSYIHNNRALLHSSCLKSSVIKSVYEWSTRFMHHTTSQILEGMKTQCFHRFRSY